MLQMKKEATGSAVLGVFHATLEKQSCGGAGFPTAEHPGALPSSQRCGIVCHHPVLEQLELGQSQEAATKPDQEGSSVMLPSYLTFKVVSA